MARHRAEIKAIGTEKSIPTFDNVIVAMERSGQDLTKAATVFFNLAGGDAAWLMADGARVLAAISAGAVFFGAMTYIGNAPNFLVLAMATQGGVHMPGFFGYLGWTCVLLLPLFGLVTMLFFI